MLAGVVVVSIFSGIVAAGAAVLFDLSLWVVLLAYPVSGVISLFTAAVIANTASEPATSARTLAATSPVARRP